MTDSVADTDDVEDFETDSVPDTSIVRLSVSVREAEDEATLDDDDGVAVADGVIEEDSELDCSTDKEEVSEALSD